MLKTMLIASLAAGVIALPAPAALAGHVTYDCGGDAVAQETTTGGQDTYTGVIYGFATSPVPGEELSFRCYVAVDGTEVASASRVIDTPSVVVVAGTVTYTASDTQTVQLCAEWSAGSEGGTQCFDHTPTRIPPPEVVDVVDEVFWPIVGELVDCQVLAAVGGLTAGGIPDVLEINAQGDVFLLGEPFWDCPPYDLFG